LQESFGFGFALNGGNDHRRIERNFQFGAPFSS
jgi:hypothetical protein